MWFACQHLEYRRMAIDGDGDDNNTLGHAGASCKAVARLNDEPPGASVLCSASR